LFNCATNRNLVFEHGRDRTVPSSAIRWFALVGGLMAVNYLFMWTVAELVGLPLVVAKLATELSLFAASDRLQRRFVFSRQAPVEPATSPTLSAVG
jgi:hypothetical protein